MVWKRQTIEHFLLGLRKPRGVGRNIAGTSQDIFQKNIPFSRIENWMCGITRDIVNVFFESVRFGRVERVGIRRKERQEILAIPLDFFYKVWRRKILCEGVVLGEDGVE